MRNWKLFYGIFYGIIYSIEYSYQIPLNILQNILQYFMEYSIHSLYHILQNILQETETCSTAYFIGYSSDYSILYKWNNSIQHTHIFYRILQQDRYISNMLIFYRILQIVCFHTRDRQLSVVDKTMEHDTKQLIRTPRFYQGSDYTHYNQQEHFIRKTLKYQMLNN